MILVFRNFDYRHASFWELGQVGSILASAIVSLIVYHYLVEQLLNYNHNDTEIIRDKKDYFKKVVETINEGVIVIKNARIDYINSNMNTYLSNLY